MRETLERASPYFNISASNLESNNDETSKTMILLDQYINKPYDPAKNRLDFLFNHIFMDCKQEIDFCNQLCFKDVSSSMHSYLPVDFVISCTGYFNKSPPILTDLPLHTVGWAAHSCKGTLAESMIDSRRSFEFVCGLSGNSSLRKLEELDSSKCKISLNNYCLYENAMSCLLRRPWSYPGMGHSNNISTHQFLEKLTRY